ncbi:MAG: cytochrome c biogenesis protein ResB [Myxococcaceae bacterium]|nr:cytochrome c biogenesis protein ResB [Myxococcaceae bacterium]MBH2006571.1 cytochrome c biogenesis protein ResB [Myxococcaceae bacterium]
MHRVYGTMFRVFASLRLTVAVLSGIGFALFFGMFWDQTLTLSQHLESIQRPWLRKAFLLFEISDVFHSWWFGILVLLLALNLIACSIARLPKIWIDARFPNKYLQKNKLSQQKSISVQILPKIIFHKNEESWVENGIQHVFFQKQAYSRCGVYLIHTALLFIMFGSVVATQAGIDGTMLISEGGFEHLVQARGPGGALFTHDLEFVVSCTDFRLKTYADGSPMEYESDLAIYKKEDLSKPILAKTIRVNDPLEYQGYTFYQASYQALQGEKRVHVKIGPHGGPLNTYQLKLGESAQGIEAKEIFEDYAGLGGALQVRYEDSEFVVFRKYPEFDSWVRRGDLDVVYLGFDSPYATGISVGKVPGISVVFLGFVLLFIGLGMAFCMNQRRYFAQIKARPDETFELTLAGVSYRYPEAFEKEFNHFVDQHRSV